jgi:dynein heavy chain, axonemal
MDWFQRWPKEALIAVADYFLLKVKIECTADVKKQLIMSMGSIHDDVAESCVTYFQRYRFYWPTSSMQFFYGGRVEFAFFTIFLPLIRSIPEHISLI